MARPLETGLRYFPMDTGIFNDRKIRRLLKTFGAKGYLVYNFVLCAIYSEKGYYVQCDDDFLFDVADSLAIEEALVKEVIHFCVSNVLFDKRVFDVEKCLTSAGIQKRYLEVKAKSNVVILDRLKINDAITPINDAIMTQKKRKGKKRKENEIPPLPPKGESEIEKSDFDSLDATEPLNHQEKEKSCAKKEKESDFEEIWALYGRKGNRKTSAQKWANLKNHCREAAMKHIPLYVASTPNIQYRKNLETYLHQECWNDEIIKKSKNNAHSRIFIPEGIIYEGDTI